MTGIEVEGADRVIDRLYKFDKEAWAVLQSDVKDALNDIRSDAQSDVPSRGLRKWGPWNVTTGRNASFGSITMVTGTRDLEFSASRIKSSIKPQFRSTSLNRVGRGRVVGGRVVIQDAAGAIFSLAGSKNRSGDPFNERLNAKHGDGPWPRLLGPAWTTNVDNARKLIEAAVNRAAKEVTRG